MRLEIQDRSVISDAIHRADPDAIVYLFGSRVDDAAKGGDIDLLVLSKKIHLMEKIDILAQLHQSLGERKIDIVVYPDSSRPFARLAIENGIRL
jgi:predicted nucleotidyltransferase